MVFEFLGINKNATVILSLAVMLSCGFFITRLTRRIRLPNVTGYIVVGILVGPYLLNLIPGSVIGGMDFITDVALAFIAFGVGKYLKLSTLRKNSSQVLVITLCEALAAAFIIFIAMAFVFRLPISFSVLLGAIGSATAPASTIMTIRQYKAKGGFVNMLLQVVALDDAVALIAFSVCAAVAQALSSDAGLNFTVFLMPILLNLCSIGLGIVFALLLNKLTAGKRLQENRLILAVAMILAITGFCSAFDISPLLACMALGTGYVNTGGNKGLFKQVNNFSPPILTLFFVLSGMRLSIPALRSAGLIGVGYFIIRIAGKYIGSSAGAVLSKASPEIRRYLGLALIPQAGVSIGLALLGQRILPPDMGSLLSTIILSSSVLYEMIGPVSSKLALRLSNSFPAGCQSKKSRKAVGSGIQKAQS